MLRKSDRSIIGAYLEDSSNLAGGNAGEVIFPSNSGEIAHFLKESSKSGTEVTVSGAGTGQAGGRIPMGGSVLSLERMNRIKEVAAGQGSPHVTCEAGVIIQDLKEAALKESLFYTYDPTEATAFVGGTVATNASGARSFKYGSTRKSVRAMTVVLATGEIVFVRRGETKASGRHFDWDTGERKVSFNLPEYSMPETKNSAGYFAAPDMDLIDLFIGQEGTLGVITGVELGLARMPKGFFACFAFFADTSQMMSFVNKARAQGALSIEYFDAGCLDLLREGGETVPEGAGCAIFFEDEIRVSEDETVSVWEEILNASGVDLDDTWVAMNPKAHEEFLKKRYSIPERMGEEARSSGFRKVSTDLAVPDDKLEKLFAYYIDSLKRSTDIRWYIFGHIGDSHLHVNMIPANKTGYEQARALALSFAKKSVALGGTVSAEHGIGKTRHEYLRLLYGDKGIEAMKVVKRALDPGMILGKGNLFSI